MWRQWIPRRRRVATRRGAKMESIVSTSLKLAAWGAAKVAEDRNNRTEPRGRAQSGSRPLPARQPTFDDQCNGTIDGHADNVGRSSDPGILGELRRFISPPRRKVGGRIGLQATAPFAAARWHPDWRQAAKDRRG